MEESNLDLDLEINYSEVIGKTRSSGIKKSVGFFERTEEIERGKKDDIIVKLERLRKKSNDRSPYFNMMELIKILEQRKYGFPNPGEIFTFIYKAKTPRIIYDEHPIVSIMTLEPGRFTGYNYHLDSMRQYTGDGGRIMSNFYKIMPEELDIVMRINTKLIRKL